MPSDFALLARSPVEVVIARHRILIPYRPAGAWVVAMEHPGWIAATLADDEDRERIADLLLAGDLARGDVRAESLRILSEVSGRKWWEAGRLIATSATPEVLGRLVLAGADPWTRSLGEWCAAVYALCVKGQDEKGRVKFDFQLTMPPRGYEDEWDDDGDDPTATMAAVQSLMGK